MYTYNTHTKVGFCSGLGFLEGLGLGLGFLKGLGFSVGLASVV